MNELQILKAALGQTAGCPQTSALSDPSPEIREHLRQCARCRSELSLLKAFESADARPDELVGQHWIESELQRRSREITAVETARVRGWTARPPRRWMLPHWNWRALSMAAACLTVALGVGVYHRQERLPDAPVVDYNDELLRSESRVIAVSPVGDVDRTPEEFAWQPAEGTARYHLRVLEVDRTEIWHADVSQTSVKAPSGITKQMIPGRTFLWEITAYNSTGKIIGSSNLQIFHRSLTQP